MAADSAVARQAREERKAGRHPSARIFGWGRYATLRGPSQKLNTVTHVVAEKCYPCAVTFPHSRPYTKWRKRAAVAFD
jgi:hypothetical protein